ARRTSSRGDAIVIEDSRRPHHPTIGAQSGGANVAPSDTQPLGGHPIVEATIMFGTLLESRARRRRRPGGAAVSVAVHVAIIGAITATAAHGRIAPRQKPEYIALVNFKKPTAPPPIDRTAVRDPMPGPVIVAPVTIRHIDPPATVP